VRLAILSDIHEDYENLLKIVGKAEARGFYRVRPGGFKQYITRGIKITSFPALIGIPSVTRNEQRSSFCIFDTNSLRLQLYR